MQSKHIVYKSFLAIVAFKAKCFILLALYNAYIALNITFQAFY